MFATERVIRGPLHPDLFGGETPMIIPVENPPGLWRVEVTVSHDEFDIASILVQTVARTEAEAIRSAELHIESMWHGDADCFTGDAAYRLPQPPSDEQMRAWMRRNEGGAA